MSGRREREVPGVVADGRVLIPGTEGRSAGKQPLVGRPDGLAPRRELARRERKDRSRFVQLHEAFHVARVGPLQEQPPEILRLGRPPPPFAPPHPSSPHASSPLPSNPNVPLP